MAEEGEIGKEDISKDSSILSLTALTSEKPGLGRFLPTLCPFQGALVAPPFY
jgi:hypothetical protein